MGCETGWLTRFGDDKIISGVKIIHNGATASSAHIKVYPPWGGSFSANLPYGPTAMPSEYRNPKIPSESVVIGYIEYWVSKGKAGRAIRIRVCYNAPDKSWIDPDDIPSDPGFGFGKAEITQTNVGPGLIFNVNSNINYSLRVMNTGGPGKLYGAIGLGYHDKDGNVYFTGRYAKEQAQVSPSQTITWNGNIEVLHKDYAAREMTSRGPAVYFMSGHDEDNKIVWDRSEYIPVTLELSSEYVDPTDPEEIPDDWEEPVYDPSRPWDIPSFPKIFPDIWDIITPKPKEEDEPFNWMHFIYMGYIGIIAYMLLRSQ